MSIKNIFLSKAGFILIGFFLLVIMPIQAQTEVGLYRTFETSVVNNISYLNKFQDLERSTTITSPFNGTTYNKSANVNINANASDSDGTIVSAYFFQSSTSLGIDNSALYSVDYNEGTSIGFIVMPVSRWRLLSWSHDKITILLPFSQDEEGVCRRYTSDDILNVNAWGLEKLKINGVDFTNIWSNSIPTKQNGYYRIHYVKP